MLIAIHYAFIERDLNIMIYYKHRLKIKIATTYSELSIDSMHAIYVKTSNVTNYNFVSEVLY